MTNNWYVITGGPSTGKTTLIGELKKRGYHTVPEAARTLIDDALASGQTLEQLRSNEKKFQEDIARMKEKFEAGEKPDRLSFFDRGMQDTLAYLRYYDFAIEPWVTELMRGSTYKKVFLLSPLPVYEQDYARTEDDDFTKVIHQLFDDAYAEYGMKPIHVPIMSVAERAEFILNSL